MASELSRNINRGLAQANQFLTRRLLTEDQEAFERGRERQRSQGDAFKSRLEILGKLAGTNPDAAATLASYAATGRPEDLLAAESITPGRAAMAQLFQEAPRMMESGGEQTVRALGGQFGVPQDVLRNIGVNPLFEAKVGSERELGASRRALASYRAQQEAELEKLSAAKMGKIAADTDLARASLRKVNQELEKKTSKGVGGMSISDFKRLSEIAVTDDKRIRDNLNSFIALHGIDPADIGGDLSLDPAKYPGLQERWNYLIETYRESEATLGHIEGSLRTYLDYKKMPGTGKQPMTDVDAWRRQVVARPGSVMPEAGGGRSDAGIRQAQPTAPSSTPGSSTPFGLVRPGDFDFSDKSDDQLLQMLLENEEE